MSAHDNQFVAAPSPSAGIVTSGERRRPPASKPASGSGIGENDGEDRHAKNGECGRRRGYFGSKDGAGVWQTIINQIPPHDLFIEAFAGGAAITRHIRRAAASIVIDSDAAACGALTAVFTDERSRHGGTSDSAGVTVICADAVAWLESHRGEFNERTVVYCDPPYLFDVRSSRRRKRYIRELGEAWSHQPLLAVLSRLTTQRVRVLVSGYRSALYDQMLSAWRRVDYRTMTRGGPVIESLWCNFEEPTELHDFRVAGENFRERERWKRKKARWTARLERMPGKEQAALLAAIDEWRRRRSPVSAMAAAIGI